MTTDLLEAFAAAWFLAIVGAAVDQWHRDIRDANFDAEWSRFNGGAA